MRRHKNRPPSDQKGSCVSSPSFHPLFGRFWPLRYFGRSCSGALPKAAANGHFAAPFPARHGRCGRIWLATSMRSIPRCPDLLDFQNGRPEAIKIDAAMQCTMTTAASTGFRTWIMAFPELCHHGASCLRGSSPSPAPIPRV